MLIELLIVIAAGFAVHYQLRRTAVATTAPASSGSSTNLANPARHAARLAQLSTYADRLFEEKKWLAAEKAYLGVLKLDHKNLTAYSHLGIIYSTQKNLPDAIECFQMATRLRPSGSTFANLGLAYYDHKNFMKSIAAYEKSIMFEPTAARYIGLSKAWRKLANLGAVVAALEKAAGLDKSARIAGLLDEARTEAATSTRPESRTRKP